MRQRAGGRAPTPAPGTARRAQAPGPLLLRLQRAAGNRAVGRIVQRLEAPPPSPTLTSPLLAEDARVRQAAAVGGKPLFLGEHSEGVARLQHALAGIGYPMPVSARTAGETDGKYGPETRGVVRRFQSEHDVRPVGGHEAGPKTLTALDRAVATEGDMPGQLGEAPGGSAPPRPVPAKKPGVLPKPTPAHTAPRSPTAFLASTFTEPFFRHDSGAGSQFLVRYTPSSEELLIGVRSVADFRHSAGIVREAGVAKAVPEPGVDKFNGFLIERINDKPGDAVRTALVDRWRWPTGGTERIDWAVKLRAAVEAAWSHSATVIIFELDKKDWPATKAKVNVVVSVDDSAGARLSGPTVPTTERHLDMRVWKRAPEGLDTDEKTGSRDNVHASMDLSSLSVSARRDSPIAFEWDPTGPAGHISNVEGWARDVKSAATTLGSSAATAGKVPDAAGQPITIRVRGPNRAVRLQDAVDLRDAVERGCGDARRIHVFGDVDDPKRAASLFVGDGKPQVVAAHEFGHLFGLGDEYATSFAKAGSEATHSAKAATMGPAGPRGAMVETNDNIMSGGGKVRAQHYAVFLDALRKVTGLPEWRVL